MKRNFRRRCRNGTSAFFARAPGEASETQMRAVESSEISGRRERERERKRERELWTSAALSSAEVLYAKAGVVGDFCAVGSQRRMLNANRLAEGVELGSNVLHLA
jgi:hypothetical protein